MPFTKTQFVLDQKGFAHVIFSDLVDVAIEFDVLECGVWIIGRG